MAKLVPAKQYYYNILSKDKFKDILSFCLVTEHESNIKLVEQLLAGALAAVELDCIADINNKELDVTLTSQHYLDYVKIANEAIRISRADREDVREFIDRISKLCYSKSGQESFL